MLFVIGVIFVRNVIQMLIVELKCNWMFLYIYLQHQTSVSFVR